MANGNGKDMQTMQDALVKPKQPARSTLTKIGDKVINYGYKAVDAIARPRDPQKAVVYNKARIGQLKQAASDIDAGKTMVKDSYPVKQRVSELENEK